MEKKSFTDEVHEGFENGEFKRLLPHEELQIALEYHQVGEFAPPSKEPKVYQPKEYICIEKVNALQFDGSIKSAHAILKWLGYESADDRFQESGHPNRVPEHDGPYLQLDQGTASESDWVVEMSGPQGLWTEIWDDENFRNSYRDITELSY